MMREDRQRHAEARAKQHEQQIESRLAQLRAAEEKRLQEEIAERRAIYAKRLAEVETEEEQERNHYIAMQEAHERGCVAAQLKRVELAYRHLCQQQGLLALERDRRRKFDFDLVVLESDLIIHQREGKARASILADQRGRFDAIAANHHSIYPILASQCVQRKAVDMESDAELRRMHRAEAHERQRLQLTAAAEGAVAQTRASERHLREKITQRYWDHKVTVMLERDEVRQRDDVVVGQLRARAALHVLEAEARRRVGLLSDEVRAFTTIAYAKAHSLGGYLHAVESTVERLTDRLGDAQRRETAIRAELASLKDTLDEEQSAHREEAQALRRQLDDANKRAAAREEDMQLRIESLERLVKQQREDATAAERRMRTETDATEKQLGAVEARLRESEREAAALRHSRQQLEKRASELEQQVADLETSVALGRGTPSAPATPTTAASAAGSTTPRRGRVGGAAHSDASPPVSGATSAVATGPVATTANSHNATTSTAYRQTVESQAATIATLKRRIVALEALADGRIGENVPPSASSVSPSHHHHHSSAGGGNQSNRELVTLLCAENKRLLDANAALLEENRALAQRHHQERGAAISGSADGSQGQLNDSAGSDAFARSASSLTAVTPKGVYQSAAVSAAAPSTANRDGANATAPTTPPPPVSARSGTATTRTWGSPRTPRGTALS